MLRFNARVSATSDPSSVTMRSEATSCRLRPDASWGATLDAFIARWQHASSSELANAQLFVTELACLLDLPQPDPAREDTRYNAYVFERRVRFRKCCSVFALGTNVIRLPPSFPRNHAAAVSKLSVQKSLGCIATGCSVAISLAALPASSQRPSVYM